MLTFIRLTKKDCESKAVSQARFLFSDYAAVLLITLNVDKMQKGKNSCTIFFRTEQVLQSLFKKSLQDPRDKEDISTLVLELQLLNIIPSSPLCHLILRKKYSLL